MKPETVPKVVAWRQYKRKGLSEMRPYVAGEDVAHVSISPEDVRAGRPKKGDMIARNPKNHADQWLVAKKYFDDNLEPVDTPTAITAQEDEPRGFENGDHITLPLDASALDADAVEVAQAAYDAAMQASDEGQDLMDRSEEGVCLIHSDWIRAAISAYANTVAGVQRGL